MRRWSGLTIGMAALVLVAAGAVAQPGAEPRGPGMHTAYFLEGPSVSVDFEGGTFAQFVEALRRAAPAPVNVAVAQEAAALKLPPVSLAAVSVHAALQVASQVAALPTDSRLQVERISGSFDDDGTPASAAAFAVTLRSTWNAAGPNGSPPRGAAAAGPQLRAFSLRDIVRPLATTGKPVMSEEAVLTVVQTAIDFSVGAGAPPAQLSFHDDTSLLIVRGSAEQMRLIAEVLGEMRREAIQERERDARTHLITLQLNYEFERAKSKLEVATLRTGNLRQELAEANAMLESGRITDRELRMLRERLALAEADVRLAEQELELINRKREIRWEYPESLMTMPGEPAVDGNMGGSPSLNATTGELREAVRQRQQQNRSGGDRGPE